jgi:hypothetical protein
MTLNRENLLMVLNRESLSPTCLMIIFALFAGQARRSFRSMTDYRGRWFIL